MFNEYRKLPEESDEEVEEIEFILNNEEETIASLEAKFKKEVSVKESGDLAKELFFKLYNNDKKESLPDGIARMKKEEVKNNNPKARLIWIRMHELLLELQQKKQKEASNVKNLSTAPDKMKMT